ncbi:hypothetical protein [Candidatus Palauibacter sp.]|uniref:hypothetical protein n=1 Tax=Candidatus Palauibacter sp. TaxID=3101350 RepID=UPI003B01DD76
MSVELIAILGVGAALAAIELLTSRMLRNEMKGLRRDMFGDIDGLRGGLRGEIRGLRDDLLGEIHGLRGEIHGLRADLLGEIHGLRGNLPGLRGAIGGVRSEMREFRVELTQQLARIEVGLSLRGGP